MIPSILTAISNAGYVVFTKNSPYDLNLFGVRRANTTPNSFDDLMGCCYRNERGSWCVEYWDATPDPGSYWLESPGNVNGTAILVPGQYRGVYAIDLHGGKYEAICQRNGNVRCYRDNNKDDILDMEVGSIQSGMFGINLHHASYTGTSSQVNKWSACCQVIANIDDFNRMMELAHLQQNHHPTWTSYTYTLLTESQFNGV